MDLSLTVQAPADPVVTAAVAVAVALAVGVGLGVESAADPPHAATRMPAPIATAIERARVPMVTIESLLLVRVTVGGAREHEARVG